MIQLRPYQAAIAKKVWDAWDTYRSVLAVLPTGGGKTVTFADIILNHNGAAAAVVHRKEIVTQISLALARLGITHRIVAPKAVQSLARRKHLAELGRSFVDQNAQTGVASVQTLTSKSSGNNVQLMRWVEQLRLCVFDEGHHYVEQGLWARAVHMLHEAAKLLFVTATPERADGVGLGANAGGFADVMLEGPNTRWMIDEGFLSPFRYFAPDTDLDVSGLAVGKNGDFNAGAFRARVTESHLVGDSVRHYTKFAKNKRAIVFATDVATAEEMAASFRSAGYTAEALSGDTPDADRDHVLQKFERGEVQVLVNVDLFDEGFDVPAVECVIMARPTQSLAKFLQQIGRGLRTMKGKAEAVIIDMVRNWERHGMPDWPRRWTLKGRDKGESSQSADTIPQRVCKECTQPYEAYFTQCPYCGAVPVPAGRDDPEKVDGDLQELDVAAMAALFEKMQAADMSDEEFERDLYARHVPKIGHNKQLRAHQSNKYRRQVLRELVAWWVGAQTGRSMSEIHRRFFHRFGTDIATAFTLKAGDTDALIEIIRQRFDLDLTV